MTVFAVLGLASAVIVRHQLADALTKTESQEATINELRNAVDSLQAVMESPPDPPKEGFIPCWRGQGSDGRRYYLTYDVTILPNALFRVEPHEHWREGSDLRGSLAPDLVDALLAYPSGAVGGAELTDFGTRIERVLVGGGEYEPGCELAVTVNRTATGADIEVLGGGVFFPVWRD